MASYRGAKLVNGDDGSERPQRSGPFKSRTAASAVCALLTCIILCSVTASSASALTIGLMSGDNSWVEETGWDGMQHSGAKIFRAGIAAWQWKNSEEWKKIEQMFTFAAERDIQILPYLYGRGEIFPNSESYRQFLTQEEWSKENNLWEEFLKNVVWEFGYNGWFWTNHPNLPYKPVTAWEVWNEPNLKVNNPGGAKVQPEEYARFLKRTSIVIKAAQENNSTTGIEVLAGGLYYKGMPVGEFLERMDTVAKTGPAFNGLALHPYSFANGPIQFEEQVEDTRSQLTTYFSSSKSLWITEMGWNVKPWGDESHPYVANETLQSKYLTESFDWVKSVASSYNIPVAIWYIYRDSPNSCAWDGHTGLLREDGTYRPAWDAFQKETGAAPWHATSGGWHTQNLCGIATSDPDVVSPGIGKLDVFSRGSDEYLWHDYWDGSSDPNWTGWSSLGNAKAESGPGSVFQPGGQTDVMARVHNGSVSQVRHWFYYGPGTGWYYDATNLEGNSTSDPDLTAWASGRLDFFIRGSDYKLWHRYWNGSAWSNWENLEMGECKLLWSGPGAVSWENGRIDVVARGESNVLLHWWYDGSWHCSKEGSLVEGGLEANSDPDLASTGPGQLDMFVRRSDGHAWRRHYSAGVGWAGWEDLGGSVTGKALASGPAAVAQGNQRLDVVAQNDDHTIRHWWIQLPQATTNAATEVKASSAQLNGTVNPEGSTTGYYFEYDTSEYKEGEGSHGTKIPTTLKEVGSGTSNVAVSQMPTGLKPSTTYHFRVVAEGSGVAARGKDQSFKTGSLTPPDTTITGGSAGKVTPDVSFKFSASEEGATFECALDAGSYGSCSSPKSYEGLSEGSHTFKVRGVGAGGTDATPAERTVTVVETAKAVSGIAVLDAFGRSENPLATSEWTKTSWATKIGASWTGSWHGYGGWGSTLVGAYWNPSTFSDASAGLLASATVGTGSTSAGEYMSLWLDMPSPGSARSGYEARFTGTNGTSTAYKVELSRWVSGERKVLAIKEGFSLPKDTTFALTETGGSLGVWTGTTSFSRVLSAYDSTYSSGNAGIEVYGGNGTAYNFRAGAVQ